MRNSILLGLAILLIGCKEQSKKTEVISEDNKESVKKKRPVTLENEKFFELFGKEIIRFASNGHNSL
ncbi:hypothetical protein [Spongiimicrobium salis]|uniref:hypothetical protein n=1 Tax=Spongiimicrobium salis TaxID=1667022 RepID=UPI00374D4C1F